MGGTKTPHFTISSIGAISPVFALGTSLTHKQIFYWVHLEVGGHSMQFNAD